MLGQASENVLQENVIEGYKALLSINTHKEGKKSTIFISCLVIPLPCCTDSENRSLCKDRGFLRVCTIVDQVKDYSNVLLRTGMCHLYNSSEQEEINE
jgi:hypothetical protein